MQDRSAAALHQPPLLRDWPGTGPESVRRRSAGVSGSGGFGPGAVLSLSCLRPLEDLASVQSAPPASKSVTAPASQPQAYHLKPVSEPAANASVSGVSNLGSAAGVPRRTKKPQRPNVSLDPRSPWKEVEGDDLPPHVFRIQDKKGKVNLVPVCPIHGQMTAMADWEALEQHTKPAKINWEKDTKFVNHIDCCPEWKSMRRRPNEPYPKERGYGWRDKDPFSMRMRAMGWSFSKVPGNVNTPDGARKTASSSARSEPQASADAGPAPSASKKRSHAQSVETQGDVSESARLSKKVREAGEVVSMSRAGQEAAQKAAAAPGAGTENGHGRPQAAGAGAPAAAGPGSQAGGSKGPATAAANAAAPTSSAHLAKLTARKTTGVVVPRRPRNHIGEVLAAKRGPGRPPNSSANGLVGRAEPGSGTATASGEASLTVDAPDGAEEQPAAASGAQQGTGSYPSDNDDIISHPHRSRRPRTHRQPPPAAGVEGQTVPALVQRLDQAAHEHGKYWKLVDDAPEREKAQVVNEYGWAMHDAPLRPLLSDAKDALVEKDRLLAAAQAEVEKLRAGRGGGTAAGPLGAAPASQGRVAEMEEQLRELQQKFEQTKEMLRNEKAAKQRHKERNKALQALLAKRDQAILEACGALEAAVVDDTRPPPPQ
ncbi:hypothetical protein WJX72_006092 [[Myrmecia] bisecta]|uniref:Uncharacterized protein n=1 Tax=[Myrmecia] bisecta TaxID=41462 RepID=A0AAW1PD42_9CHLO